MSEEKKFSLEEIEELLEEDSGAAQEVDIPHPDTYSMAGLLDGVVQTAAQDGEYIDVALRTRREKVTEGGDSFREHC